MEAGLSRSATSRQLTGCALRLPYLAVSISPMKKSRASTVRNVYLLLAGYVVATGLLNVLSHSIFGTLAMRKIAVPAMYSWAVVIPLSLIVIWVLNCKVRMITV